MVTKPAPCRTLNGHAAPGAAPPSEISSDASDARSRRKNLEIFPEAPSKPSSDTPDLSSERPAGSIGAALLGNAPELPPPEPGPLENLDERVKADPEYVLKHGPAIVDELRKLDPFEQALALKHPAFNGHVALFRDNLKNREAVADGQGSEVRLKEADPWPEPIALGPVLNDLSHFIGQHVIFARPEIPDALALWMAHTYCFDAFENTPRLIITSPEKRCGKTTLLDLLEACTPRPVNAASVSASVVFRLIEKHKPTFLIDEADRFLAAKEELIGILNAGHKRGGTVLRSVGEDFEPGQFSVFGPVAIAAIGKVADTLHDRGLEIRMMRAKESERPKPFNKLARQEAHAFARKLARWVQDHAQELEAAEPAMPTHFFNRKGDNYFPLFVLATLAGGDWRQRLIQAEQALRPEDDDEDEDRFPILLLRSLKEIFGREPEPGRAELTTQYLLQELADMEGLPWAKMPRSHEALDARTLWRMLKGFGIRPRSLHVGGRNVNGVRAAMCADAFERYLPKEGRSEDKLVVSEDSSDVASGKTSRKIVQLRASEASEAISEGGAAMAVPGIIRDAAPSPERAAVYRARLARQKQEGGHG